MYYTYILFGEKDGKLYIGCTNDLQKRVGLHNDGKVEATRLRRPLKLIYYEAYINKSDAFAKDKCSILLKRTGARISYINEQRSHLELSQKEKAPDGDRTP